jgi:hypothetical protein
MTVAKLTINLPEDLRRQAKAIAALRGETVSDVIRLALQKYVAETTDNGSDRSQRSPSRWPALDGGSYSGGTLRREEIYGDDGR